jgi:hypothetical protein
MVDRVPNFQFVDPKTGMLTPAAIGYLQSLVNNSGGKWTSPDAKTLAAINKEIAARKAGLNKK